MHRPRVCAFGLEAPAAGNPRTGVEHEASCDGLVCACGSDGREDAVYGLNADSGRVYLRNYGGTLMCLKIAG